ncbi:EGF domain-containing protein [Bradymonas sediminis]|uniref:Uncharacterized protein n=1 Tax=Bradymonas sediminis TaxID=1548548 RepID=A0A2Z4FJP8_9DELT|nr:EGF domain-containing protein [Bradymonas sediminis]AWV89227.1 hypothetical protein DN745_07680 [Bradymonas sediminis]TDP73394.1 MYXO-CTERM domain-containing protein [Bradymonas sediminis]
MKLYKQLCAGLMVTGALAFSPNLADAADLTACPAPGATYTYGERFVITDLSRGLDDSSQRIDNLGGIFPSGLIFQGQNYSSLYININGTISFGAARSTYTPEAIPGLNYPALAPFFADADLTADLVGDIYTCRDTANQQIIFTWDRVGYYNKKTDKRNSFQLIMRNSGDQCQDPNVTSTFDVEFRYNRLEWTTGDASGGTGGLGGTPATAGIDAGDTVNAVALPGSGTAAVLDLVNLSNVGEPGVFEYRVADGTLPNCGDGVEGLCEECDLGVDNGPDSACTSLCTAATCGDGFVHNGVEECDGEVLGTGYDACPQGYSGTPLCNNDPANTAGDGTCTVSTEGCVDVDECQQASNLCPNGTCVNTPGSYECACDAGYEINGNGQCVNIDECANGTDTCDPNATCTDTDGSFDCACDAGYQGDGTTCADVDECANGTDTCDPNATCTNTDGGFDCACDAGYQGDGETCTNIDECANGTDTCSTNATCTDTVGGYECACDAGYVGDGENCADVDECSDAALNTCDTNASCTNLPGTYACTCDAGYQGDGTTCADVDECADPALNDCDANATCTNTVGSFTCECDEGYVGDGRACGDRECTEEEAAACGETGSCGVSDNVVACVCGDGFELDADGACVDTDECADAALNTCDANATCTNTDGGFTCECADGYQGDGTTCADVDECSDSALNNCDANATCTNTDGGFTCECDEGYVGDGTTCGDRDCTEEEAAACGDAGSCTVNDGVVECACAEGYELDANGACVDTDECSDAALNTCDANATCTNTDGGFTCECEDGFEGDGTTCTPDDGGEGENPDGDVDSGVVSGGGLVGCSSTTANPAESPWTLVFALGGALVAIRRRKR